MAFTLRDCGSLVDLLDGSSKLPALYAVDEAGVSQRSTCTYVELVNFVHRFDATALKRAGAGPRSRICTALENTCAQVLAFFAIPCAGFVFAPLSRKLSRGEYEFEYEDLPAAALVVHEDDPESLAAIAVARASGVPVVRARRVPGAHAGAFELILDEEDDDLLGGGELKNPRKESSRGRGGAVGWADFAGVGPSDVAMVLHTSGTTSKPKTVPLTHANLCCGSQYIAQTLELKETDVAINIMPLFHIHGLAVNVLATLAAQASVVCAGTLDAIGVPRFFELLAGGGLPPPKKKKTTTTTTRLPRPNWYSAVPTMHQLILGYAEATRASDHSLVMIRNCSAALLPTVARAMEAAFDGASVVATYAMSESMPIASNPRFDRSGHGHPGGGGGVGLRVVRKLDSVGPAAGPEALILEGAPSNRQVAPGAEGEVCVTGLCVTSGYEPRQGRPDPNAEAFAVLDDGRRLLRTGDKGWVDGDCHIHLSGRFKEVINRGGEKFSPFPVEDALLSHPAVERVVCFAAPHATLGEVVAVALVLKPGRVTHLAEVRDWCQASEQVNERSLPDVLVVLDTIPVGPTGKPARINLAKRLGLPMARVSDQPTYDIGTAPVDGPALREVDTLRRRKAFGNPAAPPPPKPTAGSTVGNNNSSPTGGDDGDDDGGMLFDRSEAGGPGVATVVEQAGYDGVDSLALMMRRRPSGGGHHPHAGAAGAAPEVTSANMQHNVYALAMFALMYNWCFDTGDYRKILNKTEVIHGSYGDVSTFYTFVGAPQRVAMPLFFALAGFGDEKNCRAFDESCGLFCAVALALYVAMLVENAMMPWMYGLAFPGTDGLHGDDEVHLWFLPTLIVVKAVRWGGRRGLSVLRVAEDDPKKRRDLENAGLVSCVVLFFACTLTLGPHSHILGVNTLQYRNLFWYFIAPPCFRAAGALRPPRAFWTTTKASSPSPLTAPRWRAADALATAAAAVRFVAAVLATHRVGRMRLLCRGRGGGFFAAAGRWLLCVLSHCPKAFCAAAQPYGILTDIAQSAWSLALMLAVMHLAPATRVPLVTHAGENTITAYCFNWVFRPIALRAAYELAKGGNNLLPLLPVLFAYQAALSQPLVPSVVILLRWARDRYVLLNHRTTPPRGADPHLPEDEADEAYYVDEHSKLLQGRRTASSSSSAQHRGNLYGII